MFNRLFYVLLLKISILFTSFAFFLLFFCFGLIVVLFVATYGSLFFGEEYGSFCDDLLTYGYKNLVFSVLVYFSLCLIIYHYETFL